MCNDTASALLRDGRCITTPSARNSRFGQEAITCAESELNVSVLIYTGTAPSPEVQLEHLLEGRPSLALISILHRSTASAMGLQSDKIIIFDARIMSTLGQDGSPSLEERPGTLFFDVAFSVCASTSDGLVAGGEFERGFIQSWQEFAAFPVTSLRVLEFEQVGAPKASSGLETQASPHESAATSPDEQDDDQLWQEIWDEVRELFWLWPVVGLVLILLCVASWRLFHAKRSRRGAGDYPKQWGDVAPNVHLQKDHFEAQTVFEGTIGTVASVAYDFDPNSESGRAFASSGGLETNECLTVTKDDLLEIFARGEGWLYGRRHCDGSFGYLPEPFVFYEGAVVMNLSSDDTILAGTDAQPVVTAQMV